MNSLIKLLYLSALLIGSASLGMEPIRSKVALDQGKELCTATQEGNKAQVQALLDAGVPVDANTLWGTPLMWAARLGHEDVCKLLIDRNAQINIRNQYSISPLMAAACHGSLEISQLLLEHNAQVNATDGHARRTALHFAAEEGYKDICQLLLKHNAQVDAKDSSGKTPLLYAARYNGSRDTSKYREICELLIKTTIERTILPDTIIAFLGIQKFHRSPIINIDRYIMTLIVHEAYAITPKIKDLFAQIDAIKNEGLIQKNELREYAQQQLQLKKSNNLNGGSHEQNH